ncbi:MAG: hypothetical protein IJZ53_05260 [Tyzzerella sp.]|nr:hypothetical protein [Tyzzerella sp.]
MKLNKIIKSPIHLLGIAGIIVGIMMVVLLIVYKHNEKDINFAEGYIESLYDRIPEVPVYPSPPVEVDDLFYKWSYDGKMYFSSQEDDVFAYYERDKSNYEYFQEERDKAIERYEKAEREYQPKINAWNGGKKETSLKVIRMVIVIEVLIVIAFIVMIYKQKSRGSYNEE